MSRNRYARWRLLADNLVFLVLFLAAVGLMAWLSTRYHVALDWTRNARNSLSPASGELLAQMPGTIHIRAYAHADPVLRARIRDLVARYRRVRPDIMLDLVDPDAVPDETRALGIRVDGELLVSYQGRSERVREHSEQALTNALQRVARHQQRRLVFLGGHGERDPSGKANHDLGEWGRQLAERGFASFAVSLAESRGLPDDTRVLVIASPEVDVLPGEVRAIEAYLERGGNLLWLLDPGGLKGLRPVAERLGLDLLPGTIVDPASQLYGVDNPAVTLVTSYPPHPVTRDLRLVTLFPLAAALRAEPPAPWSAETLLTPADSAWAETGELDGEVRLDPQADLAGPLDIGLALRRPRPSAEDAPQSAREQRVVVVGDGDFLSNAFLGNGGNLDLGLRIVNWLAGDDRLVSIPVKTASDRDLELSRLAIAVIGLGLLVVLPAGLLGSGLLIAYLRRRR